MEYDSFTYEDFMRIIEDTVKSQSTEERLHVWTGYEGVINYLTILYEQLNISRTRDELEAEANTWHSYGGLYKL